jgi:hypothetical protein
MTPDDIRNVIERHFPGVVSERRRSPDGWSFYWKTVRKGPGSTRIARAVQPRVRSHTHLKLAVTSRRSGRSVEPEVHTPEDVRRLFAEELRLFQADQ